MSSECFLADTFFLLRTLDAANGLIERRQDCRAVARRKRARAAGDFAAGAQIGHQVAHRQRHADGLFRERLAVGSDDIRARLDAACCKRDVGSDDDIAFLHPFRNPVVRGIHAAARGNPLDQRMVGHADEIARYHADRKAMALGDAINLVLHRAGIGIDVNTGHGADMPVRWRMFVRRMLVTQAGANSEWNARSS
jgi:hypothetical protein